MSPSGLVVIGASAGGVPALRRLVSGLPGDFPVPLMVVLHIGAHPSVLPELLSRGPLKASHAIDGEGLRPGHIHVAPPDHHMLVDGSRIRLRRGPKEHHSRPAIDPLFRSAALSHGPDTVGVVLTGMLDDGTAGLQAIKACGGIAVVQDPRDAAAPSMPASALKYVQVDHCAPLDSIPALLTSLVGAARPAAAPQAAAPQAAARRQAVHEQNISLARGDPMEHLKAIAKPSPFVCPECKGGLWEIDRSRPTRYRCHTGHAFSLRSLEDLQLETTDEALWSAIRALQEKGMLLGKMGAERRREGDENAAQELDLVARMSLAQADSLRGLVDSVRD